jgi:putative colanic acid biosynthesis UDP-glucose lipid carrier transferase
MFIQRAQGINLLHCLLQAVILFLTFWLWAWLWHFVFGLLVWQGFRYLGYAVIAGCSLFPELSLSKRDPANLLHLDIVTNHRMTTQQALFAVISTVGLVVLAKDTIISRTFLATILPLFYFTLFISNKYIPPLLARFAFRSRHRQKAILLGSPGDSAKLKRWLIRKSSYGVDAIGIVTSDSTAASSDQLPVLGHSGELEQILSRTRATQLIVLNLPESVQRIVELSDLCDKLGVRLLIFNDLEEQVQRSVSFIEDDGLHFIKLREEPLQSPASRALKRTLDLSIALPVVVFILPWVSFIVWLLQRSQSPGPLWFRQIRKGVHNTDFNIYKYRTMHVHGEDESIQASLEDPRIFPAGRLLRRLSIDELAQFINVLNGEMSVVGPRPHLVAHDIEFKEVSAYYQVRGYIKPGITGLAQIRGLRGETRDKQDVINRVHADIYYLENWSILLDCMIIVKTAWQVFRPPQSAY